MTIQEKIFDLATELYISISNEDLSYMEVLIDVIERECLIDNEYLFSIYEIIFKWKQNQHIPMTDFAYELYEYLNDFR